MHESPQGTQDKRTLTTGRVVFLVIAAAAPMAAMVGNVPLALIRGNGIGLPWAFVVAAAVLLCFCAAYAAMTRLVANGGAFYLLVARALGKPAGAASAYVAVVGYAGNAMGVGAAFGYFSSLVLAGLGVSVPWWAGWIVAVLVVGFLGYRNIDVSAKILGVLMVLEFAVLIVLDVLVVGHRGAAAFPAGSFGPHVLLSSSLGISIMFAFTSFIGFESAALYGEETRDPGRAIPRAAYTAVTIIGVFYVLTSWLLIGGAGGSGAGATGAVGLARRQTGNFVFALAQRYGGTLEYDAAAVLLCTSLLASATALHNAGARYAFALGREGVLPRSLGRYHPRHLSPHVASLVISGLTVVIVGGLGLLGADPYLAIAASLVGIGTLGIILVQAGTALSVVAFFARRPDRSWWSGVIAPLIAFLGLGSGFVLATVNYSTLTGSSNKVVDLVPLLLIVAGIGGVAVSLRQRARRPAQYAAFAVSRLRSRSISLPRVEYTRKYVLVGGGPAGMVMARALIREGVPFDWFERQQDFGGIWDIDAPGSPMYESAEFISSKYLSGFYGSPMPADLPDYPSWRQVLSYIRSFGRDWGLYDRVTFGVSVERAVPSEGDGDRWSVTLSDGRTLEYDGLICAPGVNWHPAVPVLEGQELFEGEIRHSVTYRSASEFAGKKVLIVGAGNSGVDIACDAAQSASTAYLSVRRGYRYIPKHVGGLPTDAIVAGVLPPPRGISLSGDLNKVVDSLVGDLTHLGLPAPDHDVLASHPIMNTEVLEHMTRGDLTAVGDVARCVESGVVLTDGRSVDVDLILLCTGYEYRLPFLSRDLFTWRGGRPSLYLNVFSREHGSLYVLGFIEFADTAYKRFDDMAQLIVMDIRARETGTHREELRRLKASDDPDLRGGIPYIDSPRHANYVNGDAYQDYLARLRDRFGWPDPDEHFYDAIRPAPEADGAESWQSGG